MTKLQFFKDTLQKYIELDSKFNKIDNTINGLLKNDLTHDYPIYLSNGFNYEYQNMVIKSLSQLWNEPEYVEDWINYLIYDAMDMKGGGKAIHDGKEYIIKDVDSLCVYLLDYYKIIGE